MHDSLRSNRHPGLLAGASIFASLVLAAVAASTCQSPAVYDTLDAGLVTPHEDGGAASLDTGVPEVDGGLASGDSGVGGDVIAVAWPEAPRIERRLDASNGETIEDALAVAGTHVRISGEHVGPFHVRASDTVIDLAPDARVGSIYLAQGVHRVAIRGGEIGSIELAPPIRFTDPEPRVIDDLWVRDVRIEDVRLRAPDSALVLRGHRISIVNVQGTAERYCVWVGDTLGVPSEDIRIASSQLDSAGPEATVRMHDVLRAVVVDSRLSNTLKHNVRVHGRSDMVFIGRNILVGTGAMMANQPGDQLERIWFVGNTVYQRREGTLVVAAGQLAALIAMRNVVYTDSFSELEHGYVDAPPRWRVAENRVAPFIEPSTL